MKQLAMVIVVAISVAVPRQASGFVPEPDGFRGEPYRGPVPATLSGAQVIDDAAVHALWISAGAAFVDVLPRSPKPEGLPEGTLWHEPARQSIPGAIWLPNIGYQTLSRAKAALLAAGLAHAAGGDPSAPIVIFCLSECWMSWNAARRAVEAGYTRVFWYPEGTDGWAAQGWTLAPATPYRP
jgi:PQQ-dependent catabolism-associated CXXCW motif protein